MPNNNIILLNPTLVAASQFTTPFNISTLQENYIQIDAPNYKNPTEFAGSQFANPYDIATLQESWIQTNTPKYQNPTEFAASQFTSNWPNHDAYPGTVILSNPTIPYTPQLLPNNDGTNIGPGGEFQQAAIVANANVKRSNPTIGLTGYSLIDPSQPFDIATIQESYIQNISIGYENPTYFSQSSWENPKTMPGTSDTFTGQNTNITPNSLLAQAAGIGATIGGSLLGVPQVAQIGNTFINQLDGINPAPYLSLPKNRLKPVPGIKYSDFRSRFSFPAQYLGSQKDADDNTDENNFFNTTNQTAAYLSSRRFDGLAAQIRGSYRGGVYAATSLTPVGAYSVFNLNGFGNTGFGWGDHDNPYVLRNDFTSRSHVATRYKADAKKRKTTKKRGDKIRKGGFITTNNPLELATPFRGDRVNVVDFGARTLKEAYLWKPVRFEFEQDDRFHALKLTQDFIKFYFTGPSLANGEKNSDLIDDIIVFRAIITNLGDSYTAQWNPVNMIGRADPNYHYTGFSRDLSLSFDVYATDRDEVKPIYRKLNALAGYTAPTYNPDSIAMEAPWMRITVGDLFVQQPVVLTSLSYTFATDASWEINIENDPEMMQVPLKIGVNCSFNMITDYLPKKGGNFYTLAKEFNENAIPVKKNNNWLSDFDAAPLDELPRIEKTIFKGNQSNNAANTNSSANDSLTRLGDTITNAPSAPNPDLATNNAGAIPGLGS